MDNINRKLNELRKAIRQHVVLDGVSRTAGIFLLGIWVMFLVDFLPVKMGSNELPWQPRAVALVTLLSITCLIANKYLISRMRTPISDENLRVLIENRYPEFEDRLLTSGLSAEKRSGYSNRYFDLVRLNERETESVVDVIQPKEIISRKPVVFGMLLLAVPLVSSIVLGVAAPTVFQAGLNRALFLTSTNYQRQTEIENFRVRVIHPDKQIEQQFYTSSRSISENTEFLLAKNSKIEIFADSVNRKNGRDLVVPPTLRLRFVLDDGQTGYLALNRFRKTSEGVTTYVGQGGFLNHLEVDGRFWIRGNDRTRGPFRFRLVDPPITAQIKVKSAYPEYLLRTSSTWRNEETEFLNNALVPSGTRLEFKIQHNREVLSQAKVWSPLTGETIAVSRDALKAGRIEFETVVDADQEFHVAVADSQGIVTQKPLRLSVHSINDNPPSINVFPEGVGFSVTANAIIRIEIEGEDEFGIGGGELLGQFSNESKIQIPFEWNVESSKQIELDLLALRQANQIKIQPEDLENSLTLTVSTSVSDFNPNNAPTLGQIYEFNIVTESKFLQLIEREEAGYRKRLEDVYDEFELSSRLSQLLLSQLKQMGNDSTKTELSTLLVYLQRVRLQTQKSSREVTGIANAFSGLIDQLIHNRVKATQKQSQLDQNIHRPLTSFTESISIGFLREIDNLEKLIEGYSDDPNRKPNSLIDQAEKVAIRHNELLQQFKEIIERLVKFESHSELLDSIRHLIEQHKQLMNDTQKERDRKLFEGLLD